jgi:hypothetical protein
MLSRGLETGAVLVGIALGLYLLALPFTALDGCNFRPRDAEGSSISNEGSFWPPHGKCVYRDPEGEISGTITNEWPWVNWVVPGLLILAVASALAGATADLRRSQSRQA